MRHLEVLVVSKNTIPTKVNWKITNLSLVEKAIEQLYHHKYKVVAIAADVDSIEKKKLQQLLKRSFSEIPVTEFNNANNLAEAIHTAYWSKKRTYNKNTFLDNSFELQLANKLSLN